MPKLIPLHFFGKGAGGIFLYALAQFKSRSEYSSKKKVIVGSGARVDIFNRIIDCLSDTALLKLTILPSPLDPFKLIVAEMERPPLATSSFSANQNNCTPTTRIGIWTRGVRMSVFCRPSVSPAPSTAIFCIK